MSVAALKPRKQEQRARMVVDRATLHYQTKSGPLHALDNVSLEVRDGEFLCIIGPSGCGKTTLLWSMAGLIRLNGGDRVRIQSLRRGCSVVLARQQSQENWQIHSEADSDCIPPGPHVWPCRSPRKRNNLRPAWAGHRGEWSFVR